MIKEEVAEILLSVGCLQLEPTNPFTYASGLKGPIYCDNRKILSHVKERNQIVNFFIDELQESNFEYDHLAGLATAGIPLASFMAHEMEKSLIYVRSKPKGHGKGNQVEGDYKEGQNIILIEDLVNQASSLLEAVEGAKSAGLNPVACFSIVDYQMEIAQERLDKIRLPLISLTDFSTISLKAKDLGQISGEEYERLLAWQKDPKNWVP